MLTWLPELLGNCFLCGTLIKSMLLLMDGNWKVLAHLLGVQPFYYLCLITDYDSLFTVDILAVSYIFVSC